MHFGLPELMMLPFMLVSAALPIAAFVLVFLTYRKVCAIERVLTAAPTPPPE